MLLISRLELVCALREGNGAINQKGKAMPCPHRIPSPTTMIIIPDSVEGAVIISIVDFILSFFIISGIGVVLALLPLVNRFWHIDDKDLKSGH